MTILITGSEGYLGRCVIEKLELSELEYKCIDLGIFNTKPTKKATLCDLSKDQLSKILEGVTVIIHLAGISNDPSSELDPQLTDRMNILASKRLIDRAVAFGIRKFIFSSSASVYGDATSLLSEEGPVNPLTPYAKSKLIIERYLKNYPTLQPLIFRFGTLFGTSDKMRLDLAINTMVKSALTSGRICVFGSGEQHRPFLHVKDAANVLVESAAWTSRWGTYNYAVANLSIAGLAEVVAEITNSRIEYVKTVPDDRRDYLLNCDKAYSTFFPPQHSIFYGIKEVSSWVSKHIDSCSCTDYYTVEAWKRWLNK